MFVTAFESFQQIRYPVFYILLNQPVLKNVYKLSCFGKV